MGNELLNDIITVGRYIVTGDGHCNDIELYSSTDQIVFKTITGIITDHNTYVDTKTVTEVNSIQVHVLLDVNDLLEKEYPVFRGENVNEASLLNDIGFYKDAMGIEKTVRIIENRTSNTVGKISCFCEFLEL